MTKFLVFLLFYLGVEKPLLSMELFDDNSPTLFKQIIYTHSISHDYLNFHDLNHVSQISQAAYKSIMMYFEANRDAIEFFKNLHQIMTTTLLNQEGIWALSKMGAAYDFKSQFWILNYAVRYIIDHFQTFSEKGINPHFHEWIYIIRSFQGCVINTNIKFDPDIFINNAVDEYILSLKFIKSHINENENQIREQYKGDPLGMSPRKMINQIQMVKLNSYMDIKDSFIDNNLCFLSLYKSENQIFDESIVQFNKLVMSNDDTFDNTLLRCCLNILLMRRAKDSLKNFFRELANAKNETYGWIKCARHFLETYHSWKFQVFLESGDEEMKQDLEKINIIIGVWPKKKTPLNQSESTGKTRRVSIT